MSDSSESEFDHCMVCLESGKLIRVCGCSVRYHRECFVEWLNTKVDNKCEICRTTYRCKYTWWFRFRKVLNWCVRKVDSRLVWGIFVYTCIFMFFWQVAKQ